MKKMKLRSLFLAAACGLMVAAGFTSCSDDDVDDSWKEGSKVEVPQYRAFVLTEGSMNKNNSHLFLLDPTTDKPYASDIYETQNGEKLGDTGNDMVALDGNVYVVVNVSKRLLKLNGAGVKQAEYKFDDKLGEPRYACALDGKIYVTSYGGYVSRFNASDLKLEASVKVDDNPEEIVAEGGKLYCVNSGYGDGKTISVIDVKKFDKAESVEIVADPQRIVEGNGRLYVLAGSPSYNPAAYDYSTGVYTYDPQAKKCEYIANATKIFASGDNLYYTNSTSADWVHYTTTFSVYNAGTKKSSEWKLNNIPAAVASTTVYMIEQNPYDGTFYIGYTDYATNSTVCHFDAQGNYKDSFDAGGTNVNSMLFLK